MQPWKIYFIENVSWKKWFSFVLFSCPISSQTYYYIYKNEKKVKDKIRKRAKLISHTRNCYVLPLFLFCYQFSTFIFHVYSSFIHYNPYNKTLHFTFIYIILRIQWNKNKFYFSRRLRWDVKDNIILYNISCIVYGRVI